MKEEESSLPHLYKKKEGYCRKIVLYCYLLEDLRPNRKSSEASSLRLPLLFPAVTKKHKDSNCLTKTLNHIMQFH